MSRTWWAFGTVWLVALSAHADDIGPPPSTCPPGARGESSHLGEWCEPHPCTADGDCRAGQVCREGRLCVRVDTGTTGRHHGEQPYTRQLVEGSCDACPAPASCTTGKYCYAPGAAPTTPPTPTTSQPPAQPMDCAIPRGVEEDDGCRVGTGAPLGGIAAGVLVLFAALASRRRRPQR